MIARLLTEPGGGGLIVMVVLVVCLSFYGSLVLWIARAKESAGAVVKRDRQRESQGAQLEGARS